MAYAMDLKFMADNACGFESHLPDMPAMAIASSGVEGHAHSLKANGRKPVAFKVEGNWKSYP